MNLREPIQSDLVRMRDLREDDIPLMLDYWYRSPPGFIESMAVDLAKLPSEREMEAGMREKLRINLALPKSKLTVLAIEYAEQAVGVHTLFPLYEGDFGVFHAHIWNPAFRRRGLGILSYPLACDVFMERFNLNRIVFKTPVQNTGAIRVKEKLRIRCIGEETLTQGLVHEGTLAKVFELRRDELKAKR